MKARDIDGMTRMAAAKQAFNEVLDAVPDEVQPGTRTLGADYPRKDKATGCKDTRQLYPVGPLDRTTASCENAPELGAGVYTDREEFEEHRWYRVPVLPGQELRASVSVGADRAVNNDYGLLLRAVTGRGREIVRGTDAGIGGYALTRGSGRRPQGA